MPNSEQCFPPQCLHHHFFLMEGGGLSKGTGEFVERRSQVSFFSSGSGTLPVTADLTPGLSRFCVVCGDMPSLFRVSPSSHD